VSSRSRREVFRELVHARGESLRAMTFEQLASMMNEPREELTINGRRAFINTIVEQTDSDRLRIVVQGFLSIWFFSGFHVALDGFYKIRSGAVESMRDEEFYDYS
jgi:hypothetical protein